MTLYIIYICHTCTWPCPTMMFVNFYQDQSAFIPERFQMYIGLDFDRKMHQTLQSVSNVERHRNNQMSLLDFPSPPDSGWVTVSEYGGILQSSLEGNANGLQELLVNYPSIGVNQLSGLQHSLSREDIRAVFKNETQSIVFGAYKAWQDAGLPSLLHYLSCIPHNTTISTALSTIGSFLLKTGTSVSSVFGFLSLSQMSVEDKISCAVDVLSWNSNWVRSLSYHPSGKLLALCQYRDFIRVFPIGADMNRPITLRHQKQHYVACMAWKPFAQAILAVACERHILIWYIDNQSVSSRPSPNCASTLPLPSSHIPCTRVIWSESGNALYSSSPSSASVFCWDPTSGLYQQIRPWKSGGNIYKMFSTPRADRLMTANESNFIRVYQTNNWCHEEWSKLDGLCTAATWTPNGQYLLFTTNKSHQLFAIRFEEENSCSNGSEVAIVLFDLSQVTHHTSTGDKVTVGGTVQQIVCSPDGNRIAVSFKDNPALIAVFICSWLPEVQLFPCGFIQGHYGSLVELIAFQPNFDKGSLLTIVWSNGTLQYLPMLYGQKMPEIDTTNINAINLFSKNSFC